jgi:hypothetical protein
VRKKMTLTDPAVALTRLLDALEMVLVESSDEEIMQAATDLGMNPQMKGSAAFAGIKYRSNPRPSDFYDIEFGASWPNALQLLQRQNSKDSDEK